MNDNETKIALTTTPLSITQLSTKLKHLLNNNTAVSAPHVPSTLCPHCLEACPHDSYVRVFPPHRSGALGRLSAPPRIYFYFFYLAMLRFGELWVSGILCVLHYSYKTVRSGRKRV